MSANHLSPSCRFIGAMENEELFLIVNQHGDNRGDEAALRGMVAAIRARRPKARFMVLHQFAAPASKIDLPDVDYLPLRVSIVEALRLSLWGALALIGVRLTWLPGRVGKQMLDAYDEAVVVISAPGGPYFGDLYVNHEVVHWFYTWLAELHDKPLFLYQPSAGPFANRVMAPIRRRGYRWFDQLTVRETISADNIEGLTGRRPDLGSDSALHQRVEATDAEPGLVTGTVRDPGPERRGAHDDAIVDVMVELSATGRRTLLLPQLHGPRHQDRPYLESLAARARERGADAEVAPDTMSSDEQRALVAASDLVLAGRYHPLVFAVSARVPALVIPYEHKAQGIAEAAGIADYVVTLDELNSDVLVARLRDLLDDLDSVTATLTENGPSLEAAADATADRVAALAESSRS